MSGFLQYTVDPEDFEIIAENICIYKSIWIKKAMYANHHDERGRNQLSPADTAFERNLIANKVRPLNKDQI